MKWPRWMGACAAGSGAETIASVRENGRIVLMFCAFAGPAKIVRLRGRGTLVTRTSADWSEWSARFPVMAAPRSIIVVDVARVSDSCAYVPLMAHLRDRDILARWAATKGSQALPAYPGAYNARSIDGLPALDEGDA